MVSTAFTRQDYNDAADGPAHATIVGISISSESPVSAAVNP